MVWITEGGRILSVVSDCFFLQNGGGIPEEDDEDDEHDDAALTEESTSMISSSSCRRCSWCAAATVDCNVESISSLLFVICNADVIIIIAAFD